MYAGPPSPVALALAETAGTNHLEDQAPPRRQGSPNDAAHVAPESRPIVNIVDVTQTYSSPGEVWTWMIDYVELTRMHCRFR